MSFRIALSGLNAASAHLDVTAHNIANVNTTGFKGSRAAFADVYATSNNDVRSEERRVGKECRSRWSPYH